MRLRQGYVRSQDGTRIAYQAIGKGRPIFCCNGLGVPSYFWRHLAGYFANRYQVVTWSYRGHGRSDTPLELFQVRYEDFVADSCAVIEALDLRRIIGVGHSAGFQVLLGCYDKHPKRFAGLSSFLGTAGNALRFFFDWPFSRALFDLHYLLAVFFPRQVRLMTELLVRSPIPYYVGGWLNILTTGLAHKADIQKYLDHIAAMDPRFFATMTQGAEAHSAYRILGKVRVPTLCIASEHDRFVPLRIARAMHRALSKRSGSKGRAELFVITRGTHAALMEMPDVLNLRLEQFLTRHKL
ncbi:MAG: alpha/beta hydrolase [Deltaproteobacteria bacterium]|nr:alpha/beta hydrolase [Deltaproteobacteria bacterium]